MGLYMGVDQVFVQVVFLTTYHGLFQRETWFKLTSPKSSMRSHTEEKIPSATVPGDPSPIKRAARVVLCAKKALLQQMLVHRSAAHVL